MVSFATLYILYVDGCILCSWQWSLRVESSSHRSIHSYGTSLKSNQMGRAVHIFVIYELGLNESFPPLKNY